MDICTNKYLIIILTIKVVAYKFFLDNLWTNIALTLLSICLPSISTRVGQPNMQKYCKLSLRLVHISLGVKSNDLKVLSKRDKTLYLKHIPKRIWEVMKNLSSISLCPSKFNFFFLLLHLQRILEYTQLDIVP